MSLGNDLARNNNARCLDQLVLLTSHYVSVLNNNNCRDYLRLNNHECSSKQKIRLNLVTMFTAKKVCLIIKKLFVFGSSQLTDFTISC